MLFQSEDTMKILVVHRSTPALDQILADLRGKDYAVKHHESGLDGLFTSRLEKFDLIICGTELPIVTGYELVRAVRTYSVNRGTPVIFLADEVNEKTEKLGQALGVAGLLNQHQASTRLASLVEEQVPGTLRDAQRPLN